MKVFVTRMIPQDGLRLLKEMFEVEIFEHNRPISKKELLEQSRGSDGLLCLLTDKIDEEIIDILGVKAIANYAVGVDNIDVKAATERKIPVTNTPGVLTEATADLTFALLLAVSRRIVEADKYVRDGNFKGWEPMELLGGDFSGKTLGIIGLGRIGQAVARRAKGFGMNIIYHSQSPKEGIESELSAIKVPFEDLILSSDYISIHCPYTPETHHMIGIEEFTKMKSSAYLINTARGKVIDETSLLQALEEKLIAGIGLDVYYNEPEINSKIFGYSNVVVLPHIGSASIETRTKMSLMVAKNLIAALAGKKPPNLVNAEVFD